MSVLNLRPWKELVRRRVARGLQHERLKRRKNNTRNQEIALEHLEDRTLLSSVAVFDNGSYVDTAGSTGSESDNVQAALTSEGHSVSTFTGTSASAINSAVSGKDALLIPEQENGSLATALDANAQAAIRNYVGSGGTLVINGFSNQADDLLNAVFGWSTSESRTSSSSGGSTRTAAAAGTEFADDPSTIPWNNGTGVLNNLPAGSQSIYNNSNGSTVAVMPYGSGKVVYLGWDWFNGEPRGTQDSGWNQVLDSAVSTKPNTAPVLQNVSITPAVNEGQTAYLSGTIVDPDTSDSFTMQVNWGDGNIETINLSPGTRGFRIPHVYSDDGASPGNGTPSDAVTVRVLSLTDSRGGSADLFSSGSRSVSLDGDIFDTDFNNATSASFSAFTANSLTLSTGGYAHAHFGRSTSIYVDLYDPSSGTWNQVYSRNLNSGGSFSFSNLTLNFPTQEVSRIRFRSSPGQNQTFHNWSSLSVSYEGNATSQTTVRNVAPSLSPLSLSATTINEGDTVQLVGRFTDPGTGDRHTATVQWGDGSSTTFNLPQGHRSFVLVHTYDDDGSSPGNSTPSDIANIQVTLSDDDSGSDVANASVTVKNVAPQLDNVAVTSSIDENGVATLTGDIIDPGTKDRFTMVVDWGDGTGQQTVNIPAGSSSFSVSHQYLDDNPSGTSSDTYPVTIVSFQDDDGGTATGIGSETSQPLAAVHRGWWSSGGFHNSSNNNTYTGHYRSEDYNSYFIFDTSTATTADSLVLRLELEAWFGQDSTQTLTVFDVSTPSSQLEASGTDTGIYQDLQSGDSYATFTVDRSDLGSVVDIPLNAQAVANYNASPGTFAVGLSLDTAAGSTDAVRFSGSSENRTHLLQVDNARDLTVTVHNVAPVVTEMTLSDSTIDENGFTKLTGSFTDVGLLDTHTVMIDWGDGTSSPATVNPVTRTFEASHQYLDDNPSNSSSDNYTITATVTDDDTGVGEGEATVTVFNVAPEITDLSSAAEDCGSAQEGEEVQVELSFDDIGSLDTHTVDVDWGDGQVETINVTPGARSVTLTHTYAAGGFYDVSVDVADDDTGTDSGSITVIVSGVGLHDGVLTIIGTEAADQVTLNQTGNGLLKVHASFIEEALTDETRDFNLDDVDSIFAFMCGGDDHVNVSGKITLDTILDGGAGNDQINGGGGSDLILGGSGDDHLNGGVGLDILIGGTGSDRLVGGPGQDLLSGGTFTSEAHDAATISGNRAELEALQAAWKGTSDVSQFSTDHDELFSQLSSGLDDGSSDVLTGSSSEDLALVTDGVDTWTDEKSNGSGGSSPSGGSSNGKAKGKNK